MHALIVLQCTLQIKTLDEAHRLLPTANWWVKADGVDVVSSLEESVEGEWHGDVDLADGALQKLRDEYKSRRSTFSILKDNPNPEAMQRVCDTLSDDLTFLHDRKYYVCYFLCST